MVFLSRRINILLFNQRSRDNSNDGLTDVCFFNNLKIESRRKYATFYKYPIATVFTAIIFVAMLKRSIDKTRP